MTLKSLQKKISTKKVDLAQPSTPPSLAPRIPVPSPALPQQKEAFPAPKKSPAGRVGGVVSTGPRVPGSASNAPVAAHRGPIVGRAPTATDEMPLGLNAAVASKKRDSRPPESVSQVVVELSRQQAELTRKLSSTVDALATAARAQTEAAGSRRRRRGLTEAHASKPTLPLLMRRQRRTVRDIVKVRWH